MHAGDGAQRLLFGAAFYDEYRTQGTLERDLDLMVEANFNLIRVGESVWSTWEPAPGEFDLDWLQPVLDGAHERGISVVLGTPTYAVPAWLREAHPEIAAEDATGRRVPWGYRQEVNYLSPAFREAAERVIRAVVPRYVDHPSIIGLQVDNEPGLHLLHNDDVFAAFLDYLKDKYGTIEELNRRWGLVYWSHLLRDWDELWRPDGNHSPQYAIEWRRFQNKVVGDFIAWEADIVREYARDDHFVTTCISYERPAADDVAIAASLDIPSGNAYYKMQEALRIGVEVPRPEIWWSSGVWGLFEQGDRMYSTAQSRYFITETNAQSIGQSHWQLHPPYPGQIALAAHALISRGASMIEYWQWQTLPFGIETYWGGILPHSGVPGRIYREVKELGKRLSQLGPDLEGYVPDADVTLLYSTDTKQSFQGYPPLATDEGGPDENSYLRIFDAFYRGAFEAGSQVRIMHPSQIAALSSEELAAAHPVLVVPSLYVASDAELAVLVEYARAGGHLVVGIRTGYGDEIARARGEVAPGPLAGPAGLTYEESSNLDLPVAVRGSLPGLGAEATASGWADLIVPGDAETLVSYAGGAYSGQPAVTTNAFGAGRVTYVGTVPDRELARAITAWAAPSPRGAAWQPSPTVTVASGATAAGRAWFLSNWSPERGSAVAPFPVNFEGADVEAGGTIQLGPWQVATFIESGGSEDATR